MENLQPSLAAQLEQLAADRATLAVTVAAYRVIRASRFSCMRDFVLAAKRIVFTPEEAPALAVLDLPSFAP